jgi:hypothetical protein
MKPRQFAKALPAIVVLVASVLAGMLTSSSRANADDGKSDDSASLVQIGFMIAPVHLNLQGKNQELVGLGSYLVNARSDCNSCHNSGGPPNFDFAPGFNPYFGQPKKVDPTTYLGGGQDFGPVGWIQQIQVPTSSPAT